MKKPKTTKGSLTQEDNLGTYYDTTSRGKTYWHSRMMQGPDYPFVAYDFDNEKDAMEALLELPCIHKAEDSGKPICTEVLDFGCYEKSPGLYSAFVCGKDLTHELWTQAKASFSKHNGVRSNDQEPDKKATRAREDKVARPDKVEFVEDRSGENMGFRFTKLRYRAPDAASAKAYLQQHPVTEPMYYIEIDTPEGNFGRDIQGMYEY